jgi:hypothetical protein
LTEQILTRISYTQLLNKNNVSIFKPVKKESGLGIEKLIDLKVFIRSYPLHEAYNKHEDIEPFNKTDRQLLWDNWGNPRKKFLSIQPINLIRKYFGEKLGFYFAWLGFYTFSLILPSIIGLIVFILGVVGAFDDIPA